MPYWYDINAKKQKKESEKMKNLYTKLYLKKLEDIKIETLIKNKIKLLILDVDNTLIDYYKNLSEEVINWAKEMKGQGKKLYILSNTNNKEKVEIVAKKLDIPYKKKQI